MKALASAFDYMHQNDYAHCDIKLDNVLLDANPQTKLLMPQVTDFGIARVLDAKELLVKAFELSTLKGLSISYAAPETFARFRSKQQEMRAVVWTRGDVYSYAMVLKEMLCRAPVWQSDLRK